MSEFRQDLVTGEWVITAPERARRPHAAEKKAPRKPTPKSECPFEDLKKTGNWPPILSYPEIKNPGAAGAEKKWGAVLLHNKYPALVHGKLHTEAGLSGIYMMAPGEGEHDLVITKSHVDNFADLSLVDATRVLQIIQTRYRQLVKEESILYAFALHNWGASAGASVYHPHYQILSLPIIPFFISHSLEGSERYFHRHERCVHCDIVAHELSEGSRVIEKNAGAVVLAPFASKRPYEIRIFPREHVSSFEETPVAALKQCAAALQSTLLRIKKYLNDPDLNFYIHSAPLKYKNRYDHYHWHIEIFPNTPPGPGAFELGTGVEINQLGPENAAKILRGEKINNEK